MIPSNLPFVLTIETAIENTRPGNLSEDNVQV